MHASSSHSQLLSDPQKLQLMVGNCVQKAAELILHARVSPLGERGAVNHWFGIESEELVNMREELHGWRQDMSQPLQLDLFLDTAGSTLMRDSVGATDSEPTVILLERWRFQYVPFAEPLGQVAWDRFYKRFMVLMRSIVSLLRLLPTHRVASTLSKLRGGALLSHSLSLSPSGGGARAAAPALEFAVPPKQYSFPPPDMSHGKLDVSVSYRPDHHFHREVAPQPRVTCSSPIGGALIPNYVMPAARERPLVAALCGGGAREVPSAPPRECEGVQLPPPPSEMPDGVGELLLPRRAPLPSPHHASPAPNPKPPGLSRPPEAPRHPSAAAPHSPPLAAVCAAAAAEQGGRPIHIAPQLHAHAACAASSARSSSPGSAPLGSPLQDTPLGALQASPSAASCSDALPPLFTGAPRLGGERYSPLSGERAERSSGEAEPALPPMSTFGSTGHELPFLMEEDMHASEDHADAALGSLMMEVSAAPTLQLFSGSVRHGASSPLARSVEDMTQHLERLSRTFHEGASSPTAISPLGSPLLNTSPFGSPAAPAAQPIADSLPPASTLASTPPEGRSLLRKPQPFEVHGVPPSILRPQPLCPSQAAAFAPEEPPVGSLPAGQPPRVAPILQAATRTPQTPHAALAAIPAEALAPEKPSTSPPETMLQPRLRSSAPLEVPFPVAQATPPRLPHDALPALSPSPPHTQLDGQCAAPTAEVSVQAMPGVDSIEKLLARSPPNDMLLPFAAALPRQEDR